MDNVQNVAESQEEKKGMKKRAKIWLIIFSILFALGAVITPIVVFAAQKKDSYQEVETLEYLLRSRPNEDYYEIVRYLGTDTDIVIPAEINGVRVKGILSGAFSAEDRATNANITSINFEVIEDENTHELVGIEYIGSEAFEGLVNLTEMTLPETVTSLGSYAFVDSGIEKLTVENAGTLRLQPNALAGASDLTNLVINSGELTQGTLGNYGEGSVIENVEVGDNVTKIEPDAFDGFSNLSVLCVYNLENLNIGGIGQNKSNIRVLKVFMANPNLTANFMQLFTLYGDTLEEIYIDEQINIIEAGTFTSSLFSTLNNIYLGNNVFIDLAAIDTNANYSVNIGTDSDEYLKVGFISEVEGNNTLTSAFLNKFAQASSINEVVLPDNLVNIDNAAFSAYSELVKITFGENIQNIADDAFGGSFVMRDLEVVGPTDYNNYVNKRFNRVLLNERENNPNNTISQIAKNYYLTRKSYNDSETLDSYWVYVDYGYYNGTTNNTENNPVEPAANAPVNRFEAKVGETIASAIDSSYINSRINGWSVDCYYKDAQKTIELDDELMTVEFANETIYISFVAGDNISYTTQYYIQNLEGTGFDLYLTPIVSYDNAGKIVEAEEINIDGFLVDKTVSGTIASGRIKGDGSLVLKLYYIRQNFRITFNANDNADEGYTSASAIDFDGVTYLVDEESSEKYLLVRYGAEYGDLPVVSRPGYNFVGWYTHVAGGSKIEKGGTVLVAQNTIAYARYELSETTSFVVEYYEENIYNTSFTKNNTKTREIVDVVVDSVISINDYNAYDAGFVFDHYETNNVIIVDDQEEYSTRARGAGSLVIKLYFARIRYQVSYNLNDENGTTVATYKAGSQGTSTIRKYGASYSLPEVERYGYTFNGWCSARSTATGSMIPNAEVGIVGTATLNETTGLYEQTIYAIWTPVSFVVKYNGNGGNQNGSLQASDYEQVFVFDTPTYFKNREISGFEAFIRTGYTILGWSFNSADTDKQFTPGQTTLYNDGNSNYVNDIYTNHIYNVVFDPGVTPFATLYTIWQPNTYTVRYNKNNNQAVLLIDDVPALDAVYTSEHVYNQEKALEENRFMLQGYHFVGWATTSDGNVEYGVDEQTGLLSNPVVLNLTAENGGIVDLYAKWAINKYSIQFMPNAEDTTGTTSPMTNLEYDGEYTLNANGYTRTGYHFLGWATTSDGDVVYIDSADIHWLDVSHNQVVRLYAVWEANSYTVTLHKNDGTGTRETRTLSFGNAVLVNDFVRPGYAFVNWSENGTTTSASVANNTDISAWLVSNYVDENTVYNIYAIWSATGDSEYDIQYFLETTSLIYSESPSGTITKNNGVAGEVVTIDMATLSSNLVDASILTGFVFDDITTGEQNSAEINGDIENKTVLKIYLKRVRVTLSYDTNKAENTSGDILGNTSSREVAYGCQVGSLSVLTRGGYTFVGWTTVKNDDSAIIDNTYVVSQTTDITLYAYWAKSNINYTVEYYLQTIADASSYEIANSLTVNSSALVDTEVVAEAISIEGFTITNHTNTISSVTLTAAGLNTLKLYYNRNSITVTVYDNITAREITSNSYKYDQVVVLADMAGFSDVLDGYTFVKFQNTNGDDIESVTAKTTNIVVYAIFTVNSYNVLIETHDAAVESAVVSEYDNSNPMIVTYSGTLNLANITSLISAEGYRIDGYAFSVNQASVYNYNDTISGETLVKNAGKVSPYAPSSVTLWVVWQVNAYSITYRNTGSEDTVVSNIAFNYLQTLNGANFYTKLGYHYDYWKEVLPNSEYGDSFVPGQAYNMPARNLVLTPFWEKDTFTVVYNANNGSKVNVADELSQTLTYDTSATLNLGLFARTGYTFDGYSLNKNAVMADANLKVAAIGSDVVNYLYSKLADITNDNDDSIVTLYAIWKNNTYTLRVYANYPNATSQEIGLYKDITLTYDEPYTLANTNEEIAYTRVGYTFNGWSTLDAVDPDTYPKTPTTILNLMTGAEPSPIYEIKALWASADGIGYTVEHYLAKLDGTYYSSMADYEAFISDKVIDPSLINITYGRVYVDNTLTGTTGETVNAVRNSYSGFIADNEAANISSGEVDPNGGLVLKLYYKRATYTIEFSSNDVGKSGTVSLSVASISDITYGSTVNNLATISKNGYIFDYWYYTDGSGDHVFANGDIYSLSSNVTLYAHWTVSTSTFTIYHFLQNLENENYPTKASLGVDYVTTYVGTTDVLIDIVTEYRIDGTQNYHAITNAYEGFYVFEYVPSDLGTIDGDGTSEICIYYRRISYVITFTNGTGVLSSQATGSPSPLYDGTNYIFKYGAEVTLNANANPGYSISSLQTGLHEFDELTFNIEDSLSLFTTVDETKQSMTVTVSAMPHTYYVEFVAGAGANIVYDVSAGVENDVFEATYDETYNIADIVTSISKTGFVFTGFNSSTTVYNLTGENSSFTNLTTTNNGVITFTATWTARSYTVTFDATDGVLNAISASVVNDSFVATYGVSYLISELVDATYTGYSYVWKVGDNIITSILNLATGEVGNDSVTVSAYWTANTYTIVYVPNKPVAASADSVSGTIANDTFTYNVNKNVSNGAAYSLTGWTFTGWNTLASGEGVAVAAGANHGNLTSVPNGTVELFAQWRKNTFTVNYLPGEGSGTMASSTFSYDTVAQLSANEFTKAGYVFIKWVDGDSAEYTDEQSVLNLTSVDAKVYNLTAVFEAINTDYYTQYYFEDTTGEYVQDVGYLQTTLQAPTDDTVNAVIITREGFTHVVLDNLDYQSVESGTVTVEGLILKVYYSRNKYNVAFSGNDAGKTGTLSNVPATIENVYYGAQISDSSLASPTKNGYTFNGWYANIEGTGDAVVYTSTSLSSTNGSTVTLYAKWTANTQTAYTINHYYENVDGTFGAAVAVSHNGTTDTAATVVLRNQSGFTYDSTIAGTVNSLTINGNGTTTLSLYYTRNLVQITVTYDDSMVAGVDVVADTLTTTANNKFVKYGDSVEFTANSVAGFHIVSFTEGANIVSSSATYTINSLEQDSLSLAVNADTNVYTIVFDANTGNQNSGLANITLRYTDDYSANITLPTGVYTKEGYTLSGFAFVSSAASATYAKGAALTGVDFVSKARQSGILDEAFSSQTVTLYAVWSINSYTLTYRYAGQSDRTETYTYNTTQTLFGDNLFTLVGYHYETWQDADTSDVYDVNDATYTMPARDVVLNPVFVRNTYSIVFNANVEQGDLSPAQGSMTSIIATYGQTLNLPVCGFTRAGYDFGGYRYSGQTYNAGAAVNTDDVVAHNLSTQNGGQITMDVVWTPASGVIYTIIHYVESLENVGSYSQRYAEQFTGTTGEAVDASTASIYLDKEGNTYISLVSGLVYSTTSSVPTGTILSDGSLVLSIYYTRQTYTLSYLGGSGATGSMQNQTVKFEETATLANCSFTKTGYTFTNWSYGGNVYDEGDQFVMPAADAQFVAIWENNSYTLTLDAGQGGTFTSTQTIEVGVTFDMPYNAITCPTKQGYTFAGFSCNNIQYYDELGEPTIALWNIANSVTMVATWTPNTNTVYVVKHNLMNLDGENYTESVELRARADHGYRERHDQLHPDADGGGRRRVRGRPEGRPAAGPGRTEPHGGRGGLRRPVQAEHPGLHRLPYPRERGRRIPGRYHEDQFRGYRLRP